jgi:P pilus assembly chaperone PapD
MIMKKFMLSTLLLICGIMVASAQAEIKFDKTTHNFGKFSESSPVVTCTFTFTNTGDKPLIINQAVASCGCTVPEYTKDPIQPGDKGTIKVTYNGTGKFPGHFKKSITVRTNGKVEMTRLYIEGEMEEKAK